MSWEASVIVSGARAAEQEGDDLHPLLDAPERLAEVERHQPEESDGEERERDGGDGQQREQRRAPEGEQGLAEEQAHESSSGFSSAALSYTTAPSRISIVR